MTGKALLGREKQDLETQMSLSGDGETGTWRREDKRLKKPIFTKFRRPPLPSPLPPPLRPDSPIRRRRFRPSVPAAVATVFFRSEQGRRRSHQLYQFVINPRVFVSAGLGCVMEDPRHKGAICKECAQICRNRFKRGFATLFAEKLCFSGIC